MGSMGSGLPGQKRQKIARKLEKLVKKVANMS